jgi:ubiquinone/menaquinone biosynthesis C-methylase UbiE
MNKRGGSSIDGRLGEGQAKEVGVNRAIGPVWTKKMDASRDQYRSIASSYDRKLQIRLGEQARKQAFAGFGLRRGDTVFDVGCGTGLSFPLIEEAVGPSGRIIGVEPSPEMLALARTRVSSAGWNNVTLIEASADDAEIPMQADALVACNLEIGIGGRV